MPPASKQPPQVVSGSGPELRALFSELVRVEIELWEAVEGRLRSEYGVTLPFFDFMQVISQRTECRVQDIAAALNITVGGTSKIVDRIEAAGYCSRQANPSDRRSSILKLTPSGKRLLPRMTATVEEELELRLGSRLSDRSLAQLGRTLARLRTSTRSGESAVSA